jgi:hypothetical protein
MNIPGSLARYEKQITQSGETLQYIKTTFGPTGEIIHIAPKHPVGPKIFPGE